MSKKIFKNFIKRNNSGFTLIELLVVIAIIGLLSSVVLASLSTAKDKANNVYVLREVHEIQTALAIYYNTYGSYPNPNSSAGVNFYCIGGTTCKSPFDLTTPYPDTFTLDINESNLVKSPSFGSYVTELFRPNIAFATAFLTINEFSNFKKLTTPILYQCTNPTGIANCLEDNAWIYFSQKTGNTTTNYVQKAGSTVNTIVPGGGGGGGSSSGS